VHIKCISNYSTYEKLSKNKSPVSAPPCPMSAPPWVHGAPPDQPGPPCMDPMHGINRWKIIRYSDYSEILQRGTWTFVKSTRGPYFADFALRPLGFSEINPQSMNFTVRSKIRKIFTKRSLASEKSSKIAPKLQKSISFQPQLQI
jgi:hypothetical protein